MNQEIPGARAPYRPIDPASSRREVERSPWPTAAGARRELVCRAVARQHEPTSEEADETIGTVWTVLVMLGFCAVGAVAVVWGLIR